MEQVLLNLKPLTAPYHLTEDELEVLETIRFTAVDMNSSTDLPHIVVLIEIMLDIYEAVPCDSYAVRFAIVHMLIPLGQQLEFIPKPLPMSAAGLFETFVDQGHILALLATSAGDLLDDQSVHAKRACAAVVRRHLKEQMKREGLPLQPWAKALVGHFDLIVGGDVAHEIVSFVGYSKKNDMIDALLAALHGIGNH